MVYEQVITKTPFRVSLGGGGTDLPSYSNLYGGELISAAINKYCIVSLSNRPIDNKVLIQTTSVEFENSVKNIKHQMIREVLEYFKIKNNIQLSTFTSIPTKTGLGSSSTLIVGMVNAITKIKNLKLSKREIAYVAHKIERKIMRLEGGVQDQYISSFGGIQKIKISKNGKVLISKLNIKKNIKEEISKKLLIIYSGKKRISSKIIKSIEKNDKNKTDDALHEIKEIGKNSIEFLTNGDIENLGLLMDRHWIVKKTLSNQMTSGGIDKIYSKLKSFGSPGGKIIGAGGGGFFLMSVPENTQKYKKKIIEHNFKMLDWSIDDFGTTVVDKY